MDSEGTAHNLLERMLLDENAEPTDLPISLLKGLLRNGETVAVKKLYNRLDMDENKYNQEGKMCNYGGKFVMADVRQRLLCFEYLPIGSLHEFITDAPGDLEWGKSYQIFKGICEGLHYLHGKRCFDENQSRAITSKLLGSMGYLAPEFYSHVITFKSDIYSLGVIIQEILTGHKGYTAIENVLESWRERLAISSNIQTLLRQISLCAEISINCMDCNPEKRPNTWRILEMLDEAESTNEIIGPGLCTSSVAQINPGYIDTELIHIYPMELRFPFEPNKRIRCTLSLTNKTDNEVCFLIIPNSPERYICKNECKVLAHSTSVFYVTMKEQPELPLSVDEFHLLITTTRSWHHVPKPLDIDNQLEPKILLADLCRKIKEKGGDAHNVSLMAVIRDQETASQTVEPHIAPTFPLFTIGGLKSIDVHPTEPWILTGHAKGVCISMKNPQHIKLWSIDYEDPTTELNRMLGSREACYLTDNDRQYMAIVETGGNITMLDVPSKSSVHAFKSGVLEREFQFEDKVKGFGFIDVMDSQRLVIGLSKTIEVVELDLPTLAGQQ
ncbi:hypothetical protein ACP70R_003711 [Stipagrostis hirtigluma subsp. patula]